MGGRRRLNDTEKLKQSIKRWERESGERYWDIVIKKSVSDTSIMKVVLSKLITETKEKKSDGGERVIEVVRSRSPMLVDGVQVKQEIHPDAIVSNRGEMYKDKTDENHLMSDEEYEQIKASMDPKDILPEIPEVLDIRRPNGNNAQAVPGQVRVLGSEVPNPGSRVGNGKDHVPDSEGNESVPEIPEEYRDDSQE